MAGVATPAVGDLLAERYSLAAHVNDDSSGRQVWRGMDILLNRAVTIVLRVPGGQDAADMLSAAVTASRVSHPNIVGVYDAVDQGDCAFIVREWVEGQSLRDSLAVSVMDPENAVDIVQCVAGAVAAVHEKGTAHGNVHPGTVLLSTDDRIVLADPRADATATQVGDVRALGATLYCALIGGWPRTVPGPASLPDAPVDEQGLPVPPAELRDVPRALNRLVCDLLTAADAPPSAAELAAELDTLSRGADTGTLELVPPDDEAPESLSPRTAGRRLAYGALALAGLAVGGLLAATVLIPSDDSAGAGGSEQSPASGDDEADDDDSEEGNGNEPTAVSLDGDAVQAVDPGGGDSSVQVALEAVVGDDMNEGWKTHNYNQQDWGGYKEGIGLLLDLGEEREVVTVDVRQVDNGATVGMYEGHSELASEAAADDGFVPDDLEPLIEPQENTPMDLTMNPSTDAPEVRYLLVWCEWPAPVEDDQYAWRVNQIEVFAR